MSVTPPLHVLVATIPARRGSCAKLLTDLTRQSRRPDLVELVLDGYAGAPAPPVSTDLLVREWRDPKRLGPGGRWRVLRELPAEAIVVTIDDDIVISGAPAIIARLAAVVEQDQGAASTMGTTVDGFPALWSKPTPRPLVCGAAGVMALRAGALAGLAALAEEVRAKTDLDLLGDCGDDEALVSACLWQAGVPIRHVDGRGLHLAAGTQVDCQMRRRRARDKTWDKQRVALRTATGWPWPKART